MYCNNCGHKNLENAKYCQKCGKPVGKHAFSEQEEVGNEAPKTHQPETINAENSSYLAKIIRAKSLKRLYFGFALVGIACVIFLSQQNYITNLISGPRSIDPQTLEAEIVNGNIKDINVNIPLAPDSVYSAGYTHITQTINQNTNQVENTTTDSQYYVTILGKHIVVLEGTPNVTPIVSFEGVVIPLPSDLQSKLIADFNNNPKLADLSSTILPYEISNKGITGIDQFWYFLIGVGILLWGAIVVFRRLSDLDDKNHYLYKIATTAGYKNLDDLSNDFEKAKQEKSIQIGKFTLNSRFLFADNYFSLNVYPISQLFWAYKKITTRKLYGVVPLSKSHGLVLHFRPKQTVSIGENEESIHQHLYILAQLCPTAKIGYR